jgi:hypothetical protein
MIMTQRDDITDSNQPTPLLNRKDEKLRSSLTDRQMFVMMHHYKKCYGDVALPEAEIRQKIEIEIAFQDKLVSAFDKQGYFVEDVGISDEKRQAAIRRKLENEPGRALFSWRCFRVHAKDASVPFWLTAWLFSERSALPRGLSVISKGWRALGGDDLCESGSSKAKELAGMSISDSKLPHCCHLLVMDERLRFETLPLTEMRKTLLDGHLTDELASKVRMAFERISAKIPVETIQCKKTINCPVCDGKGKMALTFLPDDINRISINHFDMTLPGSMREADQAAIYLCRKLTGLTLQQIADTFGKTHTAVIHACKVVQDRIQAEPEFGAKIIRIVQALVSCHMRRSWKTALELLL